MTAAGVKAARPSTRGTGGSRRSRPPVLVARVTLAVPPPPPAAVVAPPVAEAPLVTARRSDLHVARRLRRRDALAGLGVLAVTLGATVAVLDVFH